jgi:hypothetical protein
MERLEIRAVGVYAWETAAGRDWQMIIYATGPLGPCTYIYRTDTEGLACEVPNIGGTGDTPSEKRALFLAARLVANVCLAVRAGESLVQVVRSKKRKKGTSVFIRRAPVFLQDYRLGRPLKIDCSSEVRRFVRAGRWNKAGTKRTARTLVRGHDRRQACGPGYSQHKTIWIEPHFSPREGPHTLLRPVHVTGRGQDPDNG